MKQLAEKLDLLTANKIELVVVSADSVATSEAFAAAHGLTFPVGAGLTESQMRDLGLYVSSPRTLFSEPAFFLLTPTGIIIKWQAFPWAVAPTLTTSLLVCSGWRRRSSASLPLLTTSGAASKLHSQLGCTGANGGKRF
jgi:hypothetical protein